MGRRLLVVEGLGLGRWGMGRCGWERMVRGFGEFWGCSTPSFPLRAYRGWFLLRAMEDMFRGYICMDLDMEEEC